MRQSPIMATPEPQERNGWKWSGWHQLSHYTGEVAYWQKVIDGRVMRKSAHSPTTDTAALKDARKANALQSVLEEEADGFPDLS